MILNYFNYDVSSAKTKAINAFYLHKVMIQNPKTTNEWSSMYYFGARLDYQQVKVSSFFNDFKFTRSQSISQLSSFLGMFCLISIHWIFVEFYQFFI